MKLFCIDKALYKLRFAVNQKSAISTFAHKPNLTNCYVKNEDIGTLHDLQNYQIEVCCFFFKFPCLHSSIFLLRANRQVNLLHFDLKLLSVLVLLPIPVRTISREKEMAFLYCSSSKEAKIELWISSDL